MATSRLRGVIPHELGRLAALQNLYLSRNALSGSILSEIGMTSTIRHLALSGNTLQGTLGERRGELEERSVGGRRGERGAWRRVRERDGCGWEG